MFWWFKEKYLAYKTHRTWQKHANAVRNGDWPSSFGMVWTECAPFSIFGS